MAEDHGRTKPDKTDKETFKEEAKSRVDTVSPTESEQAHEKKKLLINFTKNEEAECLKQIQDPSVILKSERFSDFSVEQLEPYLPTSATARTYKEACEYYCKGLKTLEQYPKQTIDNDKDCDILQTGFRNYSLGFMKENVLFKYYQPSENSWNLLNDYISRRPNDVSAQHFRLRFRFWREDPRMPRYETYKEIIIAGEILAEKLRPDSGIREVRMVLIDTYFLLASMYVITGQNGRACDSFEKCYKRDKTNYKPVFGIGFTQEKNNKPNEAIRFYHTYLEMAPKCNHQYPDVLYQLGYCCAKYFQNKEEEALKYYDLGLKAEKEDRLPFEGSVDLHAKRFLQVLKETQK